MSARGRSAAIAFSTTLVGESSSRLQVQYVNPCLNYRHINEG